MPTRKLLLHNRNEQIKHELKINNEDIADSHRALKFEKMAASPYAFYRGSNHVYWEDFYNDWRISFFGGRESTLTWINGDAHIYNYGAYANHYGQAIFCMDDFDDAIVADYQFDLWRMAISLLLDCRDNGVFGDVSQRKALSVFAGAYLKEMISHADEDPNMEIHLTKKTAKGLLKKFLKKVEKKKDRLKMLNKWTIVENGNRKFDFANEKLEPLETSEYEGIIEAFNKYRATLSSDIRDDDMHFQVKDIARRVRAGTGSLGSMRYYILLEGETTELDDDIILDMKEQGKPPLYRHMNRSEKEEFDKQYPDQGERHAMAFKALAEHPDKYLGWIIRDGMSFSIKQRSPYKCDFPSDKLRTDKELCFMAEVWGTILASRHKRASYILNAEAHEMPTAFREMTEGRERDFKGLVTSIALQYADRVQGDYQYFLEMLPKG